MKPVVSGVVLALFLSLPGDRALATSQLPWLENDYEAARAQAKQRHVPLLVEIWAPW